MRVAASRARVSPANLIDSRALSSTLTTGLNFDESFRHARGNVSDSTLSHATATLVLV